MIGAECLLSLVGVTDDESPEADQALVGALLLYNVFREIGMIRRGLGIKD